MSTWKHVMHLIITIIFLPWALVWLCCAISAGNSRRKVDERRKEEELHLLRTLVANQNKGDK